MEFMKKNKSFNLSKKNFFACLIIFLLIFIFYIRFQFKWGIEADDYGVIHSAVVESKGDFFNLFQFIDFESLSSPSNSIKREQSFFSVYYRPFARFFFVFQVPFFKDNPGGYYFIIIFLLSIISVILFFIFLKYSKEYFLSIFCSLLFVFNLSIPVWMGRISTQNYLFSILFLILSIISFFRNKNALSYFLYAIALFSFEGVIFIPIFFSSLFLIKDFFHKNYNFRIGKIFNFLPKTFMFWVVSLFFLLLRFLFFNLEKSSETFFKIINNFKNIFYANFATLFFEIININISSGNFLLKLFLGLVVLFLFLFLFYRSRYKKEVLYFLFIFISGIWPLFFLGYRSRYVFFAFPFFIFMFLILLKDFYKKNKKIVISFFILLLSYNIYYSDLILKQRIKNNYCYYLAYRNLLKYKNIIKDRNLCFVGVPITFYSNVAQFLWLNNLNIGKNINVNGDSLIKDSTKNTKIFIRPIEMGFEFQLLKDDSACFFENGNRISMGNFYSYKNNISIKRKVFFDNKYLEQNMLFITWDYKKNKFKVLEEKPL